MCWQRSMSFNSLCTPSSSTQASCVCVSSLGYWQQGSKQHVNQPWHRPPLKQVSSHDKAPTATSQGARCVMSFAEHSVCVFVSLSNTTIANALVSRVTLWCCWTQLALWAAVETKREPTRTLELCIQIKGKLKALANFLLKVSSQSYRNIPHKDRGNERDRQWVSRRQWEEDEKKVSAACTYIDGYLLVHMGQRQEMCAFLFDYIGTEKLKDRHGMVEVLDGSAYFNCCTGVPNEETHSWIHLILRVYKSRWMKE